LQFDQDQGGRSFQPEAQQRYVEDWNVNPTPILAEMGAF
jgi:hypothetical protein